MSRMEMIYVGDSGNAYKTGVGAMMESDEATWQDFRARKKLGAPYVAPIESATFLLDYYNRKGDLSDTLGLSDDGYRLITGEPVLSAADYAAKDAEYWAAQRADMEPRS